MAFRAGDTSPNRRRLIACWAATPPVGVPTLPTGDGTTHRFSSCVARHSPLAGLPLLSRVQITGGCCMGGGGGFGHAIHAHAAPPHEDVRVDTGPWDRLWLRCPIGTGSPQRQH